MEVTDRDKSQLLVTFKYQGDCKKVLQCTFLPFAYKYQIQMEATDTDKNTRLLQVGILNRFGVQD